MFIACNDGDDGKNKHAHEQKFVPTSHNGITKRSN